MAFAARHLVHQAPVLASLARTAIQAVRQRFPRSSGPPIALPGPERAARLAAPSPALVRDYLRHVRGDPAAYRGTLPAHLFPQWSMPLLARTLEGISYPLLQVMNGGCRLAMTAPLPAGEPLEVKARLESIEDDGRRAVLCQRVVTGTASGGEALCAHVYAIVPSARGGERANGTPRKEPARVPEHARELAYWRLGPNAGLDFALLTGDFNPVHWVRPYARAFGFRSTILHGFATLARALEGLNRALFAGAVDRIRSVDVRFTRPLSLPARVGLYLEDRNFYVGDAPGGPAYLVGRHEGDR